MAKWLRMSAIDSYIQEHRPRLLDELKDFIRIPSISTLPEHKPDVERAAHFVAESLRRAGLENIKIIATTGHPLVYADWLHAAGKPTVLCYGHYDVQPADPLELWVTPPFEPAERNGNLYARGAVDDKGQMYMHVKAIEALRAVDGTLPVNVKFLIEGEEEVGGASISKYVAENPGKLAADVALVSDTAMYAEGVPTLCIGLRGLVYMEVVAHGPARDLHSGLYGGAAPNAVYGLIQLLAKAKDVDGAIQIPGIYDDVEEPAAAELDSWKHLPFDEKDFLAKEVGSTSLTGEPNRSVLERVWSRPTLEVHGIAGGFVGAGAKTVIPATATAKVSIRLVPRQDPDKIVAAFRAWVAKNAPQRYPCRSSRAERFARPGGESRSPRHRGGGGVIRLHIRQADGLYSLRRLHPYRWRVCQPSEDSDHPHGFWIARRRTPFAQRKVQDRKLLFGNSDDCALPQAVWRVSPFPSRLVNWF